MTLNDVLKTKGKKVVTLHEDATLQSAVQAMAENKIGAVVVVADNDLPVGIFTERDLLRTGSRTTSRLVDLKLGDEMTSELLIGLPSDEIESVLTVMTEKRLRHMPVMDNGVMLGIVSAGDLVRAMLQDHKYEIHYLKDYITGKY